MHITMRPGEAGDIDGCLRLLPPGFVCEPALREQMPEIWRRWLYERCMLLTVLEDGERTAGQRLIAFGNSVFLSDDAASEVRAGAWPPNPTVQALTRCLEGHSPVLSVDAVRQANSGAGVNILVLQIGWDESGRSADEVRQIKSKILEAFGFTHSGYQVKEVAQEVYTEAEMRRGLAAGAHLRSDYAEFYAQNPAALPAPSLHPYLIGAQRGEAPEGSTIAPTFFYSRPRFGFKPWEQDLLIQALLGKSDAELSVCLHVSPSTVAKRWHAIYERTASVAVDLFPCDAATGQSPQTRGSEKRRHLLAYLRHHPEELRPHLLPAGQRG